MHGEAERRAAPKGDPTVESAIFSRSLTWTTSFHLDCVQSGLSFGEATLLSALRSRQLEDLEGCFSTRGEGFSI